MNWEDLQDMYSGLEPLDIPNMAIWSMTGRAPDFEPWTPPQMPNHPGLTAPISPEQGNAMAYGGIGFGAPIAMTKIIGSGPSKLIEAWHNTIPNLKVGQLGYVERPGFNALKDIKIDPAYRGQGYGKELMDAFTAQGEPRFGGTITNSPGFWANLSEKMRGSYPTFSKGLDTALDFAKTDFGW